MVTIEIVFTLIIDQESHVSVLQSGVGQQHRVVRLHNGSGHLTTSWVTTHMSLMTSLVTTDMSVHVTTHLGAGVDGEGQHRLLPVLHLEALQQQRGEPRPCAATKTVKHQETLNNT